ncbi:sodium:calcium antiporter, partial [Halomonas sp. 707D4]|nr:sodium:calcium antiporter [Halomonas sp. 707D4]
LAVSLVAAIRRHADVAVGNILGSNIFNLLGILGVSAFLQPLTLVDRMIVFDQWVMLGSAVILLVFLYTGLRLSRPEGAVLLLGYVAYVVASFTILA